MQDSGDRDQGTGDRAQGAPQVVSEQVDKWSGVREQFGC